METVLLNSKCANQHMQGTNKDSKIAACKVAAVVLMSTVMQDIKKYGG